MPEELQPPADEETTTRWAPYEDLLSEDWVAEDDRTDALIPMCGIRVVSAVDANGVIQLRWDIDGESDAAHVIGCLEQVKFLYQLKEFAYNSVGDDPDLDEELDD